MSNSAIENLRSDDLITRSEPDEGLADVEAAQKNSSLKLEAHPGEKLLAHCFQVGFYARRLIHEKNLCLPPGVSKDSLEKLAFLTGACHDFGKATNRFQAYLRAIDWRERQKFKSDPLTRHALLGAVVAHTMLTRSNLDEELKATPIGRA